MKELAFLGIPPDKIFRVDAVFDLLNGHRGCAQSHIKALKLAHEKKYQSVLILEDDVTFIKDRSDIDLVLQTFFFRFSIYWDVFFLGAAVFDAAPTHQDNFKRVLCAECAHSYIVNQHYYITLIDCFQSSIALMEHDQDFSDSMFKSLDQTWKQLQKKDRWFIGSIMTQQRRSYSDIDHLIKDRAHVEYHF